MKQNSKARLIYAARLPKALREAKGGVKPQLIPALISRTATYSKWSGDLSGIKIDTLTEEASVADTRTWLQQVIGTLLKSSEDVSNLTDRAKFIDLSDRAKAAMPTDNMAESDLEGSLQRFRQQIQPEDDDSEHLRDIKMKLIKELNTALGG